MSVMFRLISDLIFVLSWFDFLFSPVLILIQSMFSPPGLGFVLV